MKERPILFSSPMVQAILAGRKTQTRRIIKSKDGIIMRPIHALQSEMQEHLELLGWRPLVPGHVVMPCPYGQPGDRLWVRETLEKANGYAVGYPADRAWLPDVAWCWKNNKIPSIHMPRWASRITLEIINVRVERLQDISEKDALSEGIERVGGKYSCEPWKNYTKGRSCSAPSRSFQTLWESINGPESWEANPWVWVVEFQRMKGGAV